MPLTRSFVLLAVITASAGAQLTTRPTTAVAGTVERPAGPDLVIDNLDVMLSGLARDVAVVGNAVKVPGVLIQAHVTNVGTERWASQGAVAFTLRIGIEGDAVRQGVSVVPAATSVLGRAVAAAAPFGPFRAQTQVPGSLAPGESRWISVGVGTVAGGTPVLFERDKYYTVDATLTTNRDVNVGNNRSLRVGRFNVGSGRLLTQWEPLTNRSGAAGTVQVNAPPRP
jgi:hypothetical protein